MLLRRTWPVIVLLLASAVIALRSIAADIDTLRRASAPVAEAGRYLAADALLAAASLLALGAVMARRSWIRAAMLGWMVTLLVVVAWVLFIAIGANGPPIWIRLGVWLGCAVVSAVAVYWVQRAWASDRRNAAA